MTSRPILLGHRGVRGRYGVRENSLAAFDLALEHGCDGFEFDVRLTADGRAVVCHDSRYGRLSVAKCPVDRLRGLPLLEEVVARYCQRAFLDIELKVPGVEEETLSVLSMHMPARGYVLSSFLPEVLLDLRERSQSVPLGLICETQRQLARWRELSITHVISKQPLVTRDLASQIHAAGRQLFVWTVNRRPAMLRFADFGVDGIISDHTDVMAEAFQR
jgi:glycerophosphoryl diester phosphodiesterase